MTIRTPQTSVTGRFGPISSFDLSDTQRVVSVPTVVSAFRRRPFTRTHQTLLFFLAKYLFQSLMKVYIPFVYIPTSPLPPTYFHPPTDLPPPTHAPTCYLPTYLHPPPTHPTTYLHSPTSTQLLSTYLPPPKYPSTYLPPSTQLQPLINLHTYLSTNPTRLSPPTYLPTCLHTTYLHKYLPLPTHLHFYLLTYLPTNQLNYLTTFLPTYIHPPTYLPTYLQPPTHLPTYQPTYLLTTTTHSSHPATYFPTYLPTSTHAAVVPLSRKSA